MAELSKRKKVTKFILDFWMVIDPSGKNKDYYEDIFKNMSDKQFVDFVETGLHPYYYTPWGNEPNIDNSTKALKYLGLETEEYITLPDIHTDTDGSPMISQHKVSILYVYDKILQQLINKENHVTLEATKRDIAKQAIKDSKAAMLSGPEVKALKATGYDSVLTELMGPRAGNLQAKNLMYKSILETGRATIPEETYDDDNKESGKVLQAMYSGLYIGLNTED